MIQYKEIDENGFVVETYALEEWETPPSNYVESWGGNQSFYVAKWDFQLGEWTENIDTSVLLEKLKESKDIELNQMCSSAILSGFDYIIGESTYHFSYDQEAQSNFQETYVLFQNNAIVEMKWTASIDGLKVRISLNKETFSGLYFASVEHKLSCLSHYRDTLKPMLDSVSAIKDVYAIQWGNTPIANTPLLP